MAITTDPPQPPPCPAPYQFSPYQLAGLLQTLTAAVECTNLLHAEPPSPVFLPKGFEGTHPHVILATAFDLFAQMLSDAPPFPHGPNAIGKATLSAICGTFFENVQAMEECYGLQHPETIREINKLNRLHHLAGQPALTTSLQPKAAEGRFQRTLNTLFFADCTGHYPRPLGAKQVRPQRHGHAAQLLRNYWELPSRPTHQEIRKAWRRLRRLARRPEQQGKPAQINSKRLPIVLLPNYDPLSIAFAN